MRACCVPFLFSVCLPFARRDYIRTNFNTKWFQANYMRASWLCSWNKLCTHTYTTFSTLSAAGDSNVLASIYINTKHHDVVVDEVCSRVRKREKFRQQTQRDWLWTSPFFAVYKVSNRTNAKYLHILCLNLDEYVDTLLHRRDCLARRVNCRCVCVVVLIENSINSHKFRKRRRGGKQLSARNISVAIWKFLSIISTLMDLNPIRRESQLQQKMCQNVSTNSHWFTELAWFTENWFD